MSDKVLISVVLAIHNEEHNLPRCLDSIKELADELIIVDGESTDDSVKIAKNYGAKIISTTNKANFHINKQMAMDAARGIVVLQMDADEVVDEELASFIKETAKKIEKSGIEQLSGPVAWWLRRKNQFLGTFLKKGGQYPDPVIRLYVNGNARLPQKDVHEQMEVDGEVGWSEGHLLHYPTPTFTEYLRKFNRYTSFKAMQLQEAKTEFTWGNHFKYLLWMPFTTWFSLFLRHRGYVDGFPGFVFALMSGFHHAAAYMKAWEMKYGRV
jgi:glycosyltransferase involved in cell wall biosynthesis